MDRNCWNRLVENLTLQCYLKDVLRKNNFKFSNQIFWLFPSLYCENDNIDVFSSQLIRFISKCKFKLTFEIGIFFERMKKLKSLDTDL